MCIGKRNYRLYISYIISLGLLFILLYIQTISYILETVNSINMAGFIFNAILRIIIIILVIFLVPASFFVFVLILFHFLFIGSN